ncbi:MAG: NAD-glutamate dehydrogenase domain-containing protein, partial [Gemmatimonadota bacterium]
GITARGAWECVKRHFREMGLDVQQEPFTVVGIGDISGDVFGNGMLLSRQIKLVAAFDHRHVFVDPDPDPEASWEERRRLFDDPGSTWMDYDRDVLSEGGGVYDRGAKEIELSDQARALFGVEEEVVNGESLIRAVLRADVDLLWNGGIGTYVKASSETHGEVGDPGNDDVRVDAADLRADVVGEGGNLGFTQAGRVEYALSGGRINTDALDNSGGVDMSDREVNLKILFHEAVEQGRMDLAERNEVLREITDDVADRVLRNNYTQSLAVTLDEHRVREVPAEFRDVLTYLEREEVLDRQLAGLPTTEELLERQEGGRYLTRPELGVLLAYAKTHLQEHLEASGLVEDPALEELVWAYTPERAREAASDASLRGHRLHGRIVATELTNLLVDRMGAASHVELLRETGQGPADVAKAWYSAYRLGDADRLYRGLWELDNRIPAGVQTRSYLRISEVLERTTRWLLLNAGPDRILAELLDRYDEPVSRLRAALPKLLAGERREELASLRALHETDGLPSKLAAEFASFQYLDGLLPVAEVARARNLDARRVGEVYFGLAGEIDFPWLQQQLARISGDDLWEQRAAKTLSLELEAARTRMSANLVKAVDREGLESALGAFRNRYGEELGRIRKVLTEIQTLDAPGLAALMVVVHAIQSQPLARPKRQ